MEEKIKLNLPIKVIIIGLTVTLIGCLTHICSNFINESRRQHAISESEKAKDRTEKRLESVNSEHRKVSSQYDAKLSECFAINTRSDDWEEKSNKCQNEEQKLQDKLLRLQEERDELSNKTFPVEYKKVNPVVYKVFYITGSLIVVFSILGTVILNLIKNKKVHQS